MTAISLDQVLRNLDPNGEVRFNLADFPLDELLLTLHETRFSGRVELGLSPDVDRLSFRDGKLLDVVPQHFLHVEHLATILKELRATTNEALRTLIEEDANMDGAMFSKRLINRGIVPKELMRRAMYEQARRRLFQLYDQVNAPALVRQGPPFPLSSEAQVIDVLPAVGYGIVVRANATRRQAMLAFAAHKRVRLLTRYDVERNRCGLPPPLLEATTTLLGEGVLLGTVPNLPGLTPDTTAGLLLLLQRMSLLTFAETTRPHAPATSVPPTSTTDRDPPGASPA